MNGYRFRLPRAIGLLAIVVRLVTWAAAFALAAAAPAVAFDLQGHRGARGLAPENTLAAFSRALAIGVTTLETDLAITRDNVLVLSHDPYLNADLVRGPDGQWLAARGPLIHALTFEELQRYDVGRVNPQSRYARQFPDQVPADGARIPSLEQLFALVRASGQRVRFNLETKLSPVNPENSVDAEAFAARTIAAIRKSGWADRVTLQSFDWRTLVLGRKLAPEIETVCLTSETESFDTVQRAGAAPSPWHAGLDLRAHGGSLPRLARAAGCSTWSPYWRNLSSELVVEAHALGLKVLPWTVNDRGDIARVIAMQVDGVITDYPDRARTVMREAGLPLP